MICKFKLLLYSLSAIIFFYSLNLSAHSQIMNKNPKIVVIGAGLAGLNTAYRLTQKGFDVEVYEARNRVGGRVLSVFVNESIAELGGENIADGGDCNNIHQLIQELGLEVISNTKSFTNVFHHNNEFLQENVLIKQHKFDEATLKEKLDTLKQTCSSMQEVLSQLFHPDDPLFKCISRRYAGYEGASLDQLSSSYVRTLYHMLHGGVADAHQDNNFLFERLKDGNSSLAQALSNFIGLEKIHLGMPLISVTKDQHHSYLLTFKNGFTTNADILVLAIPCPVYKNIYFDEQVIPAQRVNNIRSISNGMNAKIIVPLAKKSDTSTIFMNDVLGIFSFYDTMETIYLTGQESRFSSQTIKQTYSQAQPLLIHAFAQASLPTQEPIIARDESFTHYAQPIGYSWPNDPFAQGSYSYIAPGQDDLFTSLLEIDGFLVKKLFAPINQSLFFAGEHASTLLDVAGTMETACQSGKLTADMIEKLSNS